MLRTLRTLLFTLVAGLSGGTIAAPACIDQGGIGGTGRAPAEGGLGGNGAPAGGIGGTGAPLANGVGGTGAPMASGVGGTGAPMASGVGGTGAPASGIGGTGAPVASGIGGTGAPASGIGGTGAPASGIGGTGAPLATGGIGGTGIVGTITGFASVCINGVEVHFEAETPVDMNAQPATIANLAIGQVVAIRAGESARGLEALSISIINAYEGPVTNLGRGDTFRVMGQPVRLVLGNRPAELHVGDNVRVGGLRAPGGELLATYLVAAPELADVSVAGAVADGRRVGGVSVSRKPVGVAAAIVRGRWSRDAIQARQILPDPATESLRRADRAIIEGIVHGRAGDAIHVGTIDVRLPSGVVFSGGAQADLQPGSRVRITANRDAASVLRAESVQFVANPADLIDDIDRRRGDDGDESESDHGDRSGSGGEGRSDERSETGTREDSGGTELRTETRSDFEDERSTTSIKQLSNDSRNEIEIEIESKTDSGGGSRERFEREERHEDATSRSDSRERLRMERGSERSEERVRSERFDESGRRIERIEMRTRDGQREIEREIRRREEDARERIRVDRAERPDRVEEPERVERVERIEEPEKIERVERIEEPEKVERVERIEEPEKIERVERIEEPEKIERVERIEEPEKVERVERIEEPEEIERIERIEEPEKIERIEKIDEPEEIERIDKSGPGG
ncbi:MAG: hypothetical protein KDH15_05520 [Rhodocyclaceae bacterium]|nr:hypothetical protein [Rhodocyclaceae bacterium]